jgi:FtsP/CotA-like multicopper oxidase with cupredoxin domain
VPDGATLPWKLVDGVKVFHLVAEESTTSSRPACAKCWGYNGRVRPMVEVVEGHRVRFYVTNRLPSRPPCTGTACSLPNEMDGVAGLNQRAIAPGRRSEYSSPLRQHGAACTTPTTTNDPGALDDGPFASTPRRRRRGRSRLRVHAERWKLTPGTARPDPNEMTDFNVLTFNARAHPGTTPLVVRRGDRVRIRLGNLSAMDHHPIHLHGYQFRIVETDGGAIPESAQQRETTVLVQTGSTKTIEFVADEPGDWALHCHMTHHVMNQMGHQIPNLVGVDVGDLDRKVRGLLPDYMTMGANGMGDMGEMGMAVPKNSLPMAGSRGPFGAITMGGMFTILKVRDGITSYDDPGWYPSPEKPADVADPAELKRDGIEPGG